MAVVEISELLANKVCDSLERSSEEQKITDPIKQKRPESGNSDHLQKPDITSASVPEKRNSSVPAVPNIYKHGGTPMSNFGFLKLQKSDLTLQLLMTNQKAYLLLNLIAIRAYRSLEDSNPYGLEIGEALIGDHDTIGLTRSEYRHAIKYLVNNKFIKIVETCRKKVVCTKPRPSHDQKATNSATITTTIRGTKVKLIDNTVWDINPDKGNIDTTITATIKTTITRPSHDHEEEEEEDINKLKTTLSRGGVGETRNKPKATYVASAQATALLAEFHSLLLESKPDFPKERLRKKQTQYQSAERLLKLYSHEELSQVMRFALKPGGFWLSHVHSMTYFEKKITTLVDQYRNPYKPQGYQKPLAGQRHLYNEGVKDESLPSKNLQF